MHQINSMCVIDNQRWVDKQIEHRISILGIENISVSFIFNIITCHMSVYYVSTVTET